MKKPEEWFLKDISEYWSQQNDSIHRYSRKLAELEGEERSSVLDAIRRSVISYVNHQPENKLVGLVINMVENLYKSAQKDPIIADEALFQFLEASAGEASRYLSSLGFRVHYLIDNSFQPSLWGMARPLQLYDRWFGNSGLLYICPQEIAFQLVLKHGRNKEEYFDLLPEVIGPARQITSNFVKRCHEEGRHYVLLDADAEESSFEDAIAVQSEARTITVIRDEAPVPGSRCSFMYVDEKGEPLVPVFLES